MTAEAEGTLIKIVAQEGEDIPVKGLLAYIGEAGEQVGAAPAQAAPVQAAAPAAEKKPAGETKVAVIAAAPRLCCGNQSGTAGRQGNAD